MSNNTITTGFIALESCSKGFIYSILGSSNSVAWPSGQKDTLGVVYDDQGRFKRVVYREDTGGEALAIDPGGHAVILERNLGIRCVVDVTFSDGFQGAAAVDVDLRVVPFERNRQSHPLFARIELPSNPGPEHFKERFAAEVGQALAGSLPTILRACAYKEKDGATVKADLDRWCGEAITMLTSPGVACRSVRVAQVVSPGGDNFLRQVADCTRSIAAAKTEAEFKEELNRMFGAKLQRANEMALLEELLAIERKSATDVAQMMAEIKLLKESHHVEFLRGRIRLIQARTEGLEQIERAKVDLAIHQAKVAELAAQRQKIEVEKAEAEARARRAEMEADQALRDAERALKLKAEQRINQAEAERAELERDRRLEERESARLDRQAKERQLAGIDQEIERRERQSQAQAEMLANLVETLKLASVQAIKEFVSAQQQAASRTPADVQIDWLHSEFDGREADFRRVHRVGPASMVKSGSLLQIQLRASKESYFYVLALERRCERGEIRYGWAFLYSNDNENDLNIPYERLQKNKISAGETIMLPAGGQSRQDPVRQQYWQFDTASGGYEYLYVMVAPTPLSAELLQQIRQREPVPRRQVTARGFVRAGQPAVGAPGPEMDPWDPGREFTSGVLEEMKRLLPPGAIVRDRFFMHI